MKDNIQEVHAICKKALTDGSLSKDEILVLLNCPEEHSDIIFQTADAVRKKEVGDQVHLRGLIEFSNYCKKNCEYCGIRGKNKNIERYRLNKEEILQTALRAESLGYRSVVMQSGEDPYFTAEVLADIISTIKAHTDLAITMSAGEFTYEEYKTIKEAGADRYLLRFETSSEELYKKLHPDSEFSQRMECLHMLSDLGYQVGSGFMVGLPGETPEILADNLLLLQKLDLDMAGIGPFLPNSDTNLAGAAGGTLINSLKAVALARLLLRNAHIPATTAMGSLDPKGREKALQSGANVVMPNVTPEEFREMYQLYPNKICLRDDPAHCRKCITGKIQGLGRTVSNEHGHSLKIKKGY
ncbi:MAG: hydE [Clostridia bacterium]|jgi:biotin synthase|nr:hydE [Clostridia bacterium]